MSAFMRHLSRNVVGYLALFIALGGTSYAVTVGSAGIVNNSVRSVDLKNNDVRGKDVRNNSITGSDVRESSLGKVRDAGALDGRDSSAFLSAGGTAQNANRLAGLNIFQVRSGLAQAGATNVQTPEVNASGIGFVQRGGPQVTVDVPASGLVSVYAEAEIKSVGGIEFGVVGLIMDDVVFPGLNDCGGGGGNLLKQTGNTSYLRTVTRPDETTTCSNQTLPGGPLVLRTTPGRHTFELRYVSGGVGGADFRNRVLSVTPLP